MPLTLYRRHSEDCRVHDTKLKPREKRFFTDCECPIWITGTTDTEKFPRQPTHLRDWKAAEARLKSPIAGSKDETVHGPKLADCIQRYLDSKRRIKKKTQDQYRLALTLLKDFAHGKNKYFVAELNVDLVEDYITYGLAGRQDNTKSTLMAKVRKFLKDAYRRDWIKEPLVEKIETVKAVYEQKQPYTDEEVESILNEAGKLKGGTNGYATNGTTFRLMLELMLQAGFRVSDVVRFDPKRLEKSQYLWVYSFRPHKTKKDAATTSAVTEAFLTDEMKKAIDECKWFSTKLPFAYRAVSKDDQADYLTGAARERMQAIGERCGVADCRPHRLRDTFAVRLLLKGMALDDVSKLLGHKSIAVTEKYYSPWITGRKLRLEKIFAESLVNSKGN